MEIKKAATFAAAFKSILSPAEKVKRYENDAHFNQVLLGLCFRLLCVHLTRYGYFCRFTGYFTPNIVAL